MTKDVQTVTVNDAVYAVSDLTEKAKHLISEIQELDTLNRQSEVNIKMQERSIARNTTLRNFSFDALVVELENVPSLVLPTDEEKGAEG